jgi:hypothetical protein
VNTVDPIQSKFLVIRRVALWKAMVAGAAGALAWEVATLGLIAAGLPFSDVSRGLGQLAAPSLGSETQWTIGLAIHLVIGAIWTIFYAYLFWSTLELPPSLQGWVFSNGPALLTGLIVIPQTGLMHVPPLHPGVFAIHQGWVGPVGIFVNHWIYGLVMGSLYVRPVGSPVSRELRHA